MRVKDKSPDCSIELSENDLAVAETSMLQEIKFAGNSYNLILENYLLGVLQEGEEENMQDIPGCHE